MDVSGTGLRKSPPLQVLQLVVVVLSPVLSLVFVALRIYARRKANISLGWDDWTVIVANILSFGLIVPSWMHIKMWFLGYHVYDIPCCFLSPNFRTYYHLLIIQNLLNIPILPLVKVSIILLLMRASSVISWLKKTLYSILVFTIGCALFPWILYIFVCPPTSGNIWATRTFGGLRCLSRPQQGEMLIFTTCANLLTDVLILPIPFIIARRMMSATILARLVLLSVFLCSLAVTAIGAAKIYLSVDSQLYAKVNVDWTYNANYIIGHIENCVAIIVANIPVLRGLITQWVSSFQASPRSPSSWQAPGSRHSIRPKPNNFLVRKLFPGVHDRFKFSLSTRRANQSVQAPPPAARRNGSRISLAILPTIANPNSHSSLISCEMGDHIHIVKDEEK